MKARDAAIVFAILFALFLGVAPATSAPDREAKIDPGTGPGWVVLTGKDFLNVNCYKDTWRWEGGHAFC